jgi:hypothetical protein
MASELPVSQRYPGGLVCVSVRLGLCLSVPLSVCGGVCRQQLIHTQTHTHTTHTQTHTNTHTHTHTHTGGVDGARAEARSTDANDRLFEVERLGFRICT